MFAEITFFRFPNHILNLKELEQPQNTGKVEIERNCFSKTYSEIESTWSINSSKEEIVLSRDNKKLFLQSFV